MKAEDAKSIVQGSVLQSRDSRDKGRRVRVLETRQVLPLRRDHRSEHRPCPVAAPDTTDVVGGVPPRMGSRGSKREASGLMRQDVLDGT